MGSTQKIIGIILLIFILMGATCIFMPFIMLHKADVYSKEYTQTATATVVDCKVKRHTTKSKHHARHITYSYYPVYEFTADGKRYRKENEVSYSEEYCTVGNKITVIYNPSDPNKSCISTDIDRYKSIIYATPFLIVFGIFIVCGVLKLFGKLKK